MNIMAPITNDDLRIAAKLIYQADRYFYDLFPNSVDEIVESIFNMYEDKNTTFSKVKSIYVDSQMVGAILYFPALEIRMRQMFSLPYLIQGEEFDNNVLREFGKGVPIVESNGLYLSHMIIDSEHQGKGLCKRSMDILCRLAIADEKEEIVLHVRSDNSAALRCYSYSGFLDKDKGGNKTYILLKKKLI